MPPLIRRDTAVPWTWWGDGQKPSDSVQPSISCRWRWIVCRGGKKEKGHFYVHFIYIVTWVLMLKSDPPILTIPAVSPIMGIKEFPYLMVWVIPQYWLAEEIFVIGLHGCESLFSEVDTYKEANLCTFPINFDLSKWEWSMNALWNISGVPARC